ncbi:MAG: hypothetical protein K8L97_08575 [Anaerolineae bacterium]|nr:hypothetical protein [Anaerolineae bacterium]
MNNEIPFHLHGDDGALYTVDVMLDRREIENPHYDVDLVRSRSGCYGESIEQRLTLGEYEDRRDAALYRNSVEDVLVEHGLAGLGDAAERITHEPILYEGQYLIATFPPDADIGTPAAAHLLHVSEDDLETMPVAYGLSEAVDRTTAEVEDRFSIGGYETMFQAAHAAAVTNRLRSPEASLFSASNQNLASVHDDPLQFFRNETHSNSLTTNEEREMATNSDNLNPKELTPEIFSASPEIEIDTQPYTPIMPEAEHFETATRRTGVAFVGEIDEQVNYSFEIAPGQEPGTVELLAQKWWLGEDDELKSQHRPIHEYDKNLEMQAFSDAVRLYALGEEKGREAVLERAVDMAREDGYIDADQTHLFTAGPPDPYTKALVINPVRLETDELPQMDPELSVELPEPDYPTIYREFAEEAAREREANASLEGSAWFEATFEKSATELLQPINDTVNYALVVQDADPWTVELAVEKYWREPNGYLGIQSVTLDTYDPELSRVQAEQDREALLEIHDQRGLEGMMHQAELMAVHNDWLVADRGDPRLFMQGPPDRFETLAQQLEDEINPYWNTDGEKIEDPVPQAEVENPYWRLDTLPVNDPAGEPLGHALHMVVYPGLERNPEAVSSPAMPEDEPFRMLEMAHFETTAAADKFGKEFNGYLIPGMLDGPELAQEVTRLEGLPVEWKTLEGDDLKAYQNTELTLTRDSSAWYPYNPNAERDARIAAEGVYYDPLQSYIEGNGNPISNISSLDLEI